MGQLTQVSAPAELTQPRGGLRPVLVRRMRTRALAGFGLVAVLVAGLLIWRAGRDDGPDAKAPAATGTATVTRRDLVITEQVSGTLGYGDQRDLGAHRSGVVTALAPAGHTVRQGHRLYSIDLKPTVLLTGDEPAYRTLSTDSSDGEDIRQLERDLVTLGYGKDLTVDKHFTSATADAVRKWEKHLGRDDPDGTVSLGDVVFAPGPVRVSAQPVSIGTQVQTTTAVLSVSSTAKVADVDLDVTKSDLVVPKDEVSVTLPDGRTTTGRVASVGTESSTDPANPSATPTVPLVVTLSRPKDAADFDSGAVDVTIEQSSDQNVLAVPVTALVALAEGGYAVEVPDTTQPSGHRLLAVKTGTITDDYAGITGTGIHQGLVVVVPA